MEMVKLFIDNSEIEVEKGSTIIQACKQANIEIPRFCYHERLSIAGNCRMCLVEVKNSPKPVASCTMPVAEGMNVYTNTPLVKTAREGVMEFLLANHPLDCPICDQGGECDLQDQAMIYGNDRSRFYEYKRAVEDKNCGPLIKTIMTRCIHCTRCVRFAAEIAGVEDLGVTGRGQTMEIGTYVEKTINSELSGNIIDLCPVGALTSKPYAFTARPWELKSTESIDVLDAIGSNIRIDSRGTEIMRILPRLNEDINEEWISDKTRFAYDGLKRQRLNSPMIRENGKFIKTDWKTAFNFIKNNISNIPGNKIGAVVGNLADAESIIALKDLMNRLGSSNLKSSFNAYELNSDLRVNYLSNTTISKFEETDVCLLIGTNPRFEAPLVNTRLRKNVLSNDLLVGVVGEKINLTYDYEYLGESVETLIQIAEGKHSFCKYLRKAEKPSIIVGMNVLQRIDGKELFNIIKSLTKFTNLVVEGWNGINVLHFEASRVGALDLGFVPGVNSNDNFIKDVDALYLLGVDNIDNSIDLNNKFVIYQGHHGDVGAHLANVILPGSAYTEKNGTYVNLEGRVQETKFVFLAPDEAREDWKIIRALSEILNVKLKYDTLDQVRERLNEVSPNFGKLNKIENFSTIDWFKTESDQKVKVFNSSFKNLINNFYMTDSISRSSQTMAKCSKELDLNSN